MCNQKLSWASRAPYIGIIIHDFQSPKTKSLFSNISLVSKKNIFSIRFYDNLCFAVVT